IRNVLDEVAKHSPNARLGHRLNDASDPPSSGIREFTGSKANEEALTAIAHGDVDVLGATSFFWGRESCACADDVLFIDEAGQMSLANALAVSQAAPNLVMLGDPQQLEQPQKGSHPDGVDVSALDHVLGLHATMPPDRGMFLEKTYRLPPKI